MNFDLSQTQTLRVTGEANFAWKKIRDSNDPAWSLDDGSRDLAPDQFGAGALMEVILPPKSFSIYVRYQESDDLYDHGS